MRRFSVQITGSITLTVADIWPDGDGPETPHTEDVQELLDKQSIISVLRDWDLEEHFDFQVFGEKDV